MLNPKNLLPGNEQYQEFTPVTVPKYKRKKQVYYYYRSDRDTDNILTKIYAKPKFVIGLAFFFTLSMTIPKMDQ
ncbi:hypothetical protein [Pelosinus baikalensis]|uniref:Uncharacterized protein n=1 Tax=Pelosinus baikalensis TaxID=2892015 RepID=A0ABS8I0T2_9FIRM|nr:hypothetical protein [Pelosinus baikalensis]MCC5468449.1 hypothetical protein [Pelosinus baikalensis]